MSERIRVLVVDDSALMHNRSALAHGRDYRERMTDENQGHGILFSEPTKERQNLGLHRGVER